MAATADGCRASPCRPSRMSAVRNQRIPGSRDFALTASPCRRHRRGRRSPQANDVAPDGASTLPHRKIARRTPGGTWVCRFSIWLAWAEQYRNVAGRQAAPHQIMCRRTEGDKPCPWTNGGQRPAVVDLKDSVIEAGAQSRQPGQGGTDCVARGPLPDCLGVECSAKPRGHRRLALPRPDGSRPACPGVILERLSRRRKDTRSA